MYFMTKSDYEKLVEDINLHNVAYYQNASPTITDREFDKLLVSLSEIEAIHPEWITDNSPSRRVGGDSIDGFKKVKHASAMLSLENTYNAEDMGKFMNRIDEIGGDVVVEPKIDGLSISLVYENGKLISAVTRGNGEYGDDVTENIKTIRSLPRYIENAPPLLEVRGEVYMTFAGFEKLNTSTVASGRAAYANPRNAASGSLKLLDSNETAKRPLSITLYSVNTPEIASHNEALEKLKDWGLPTQIWKKVCRGQDSVFAAITEFESVRKTLPFPTDGAVIKVNENETRKKLGFTSKAPRWAFAYKFEPEQASTKLIGITLQVGRTGVISPVGELEPVEVSGSTISRVTLHNFSEIKAKDVRIGDTVVIEKAGEVIPYLVSVDKSKRDSSIEYSVPTSCPCCSSSVVFDGIAAHCTSSSCPDRVQGSLMYFSSKECLDIEGLGEGMVKTLWDSGLVKGITDIYNLKESDILGLPGVGAKKASKLISGIENSKKEPAWRTLAAIGIPEIGATSSKKLIKNFGSIQKIASASLSELLSVEDIGVVVSENIVNFFKSSSIIEDLEKAGLNMAGDVISGSLFSGKTFVITGSLSHSREHFVELIEKNGGKVSGSVSAKTSYLLAGEEAGSKLEKATKLGVNIIDEGKFTKLLNSANSEKLEINDVAIYAPAENLEISGNEEKLEKPKTFANEEAKIQGFLF